MKNVLIIEDEPTLVAALRYNLEREGHRVLAATDGETGLSLARAQHPDAVILDLMLPGMSGLEICRVLRRESTVPILILTARAEETDKVVGLELGADDYVTKPFSMRELLARVGALLRRGEMGAAGEHERLTAGDIVLDLTRREATKGGVELVLKPKEYELLAFFMKNRGRAFSRDQLLSQVWGYDFAGDSRTVDVHVSWLRQKIEAEPSKPARLITVRGVGYRFD
ncbi:MAG TPA: response regulator transcription factor [Dehalococcoidia bacterium]|nr:response regulator transcription factor [Dehalococcoidia bacterium]